MSKMEKTIKVEGAESEEERWVNDSSVDHRGELPLRATTGAWKASYFIIAIEFSERLSYFGLASSLILYLTAVIHQDLKTAAKNNNYWSGVTTLMPLMGGFIADSYLGRYLAVFVSSAIYLLGLILLTLSWYVPSLRPCDGGFCNEPRKVHEIVFFMAIYMISIGTGGHKPSLQSFGADQFDDDHDVERKQKMSFFNWWSCGVCSGILLGLTVIVYVQEHESWGAADIILTASMAFSLTIFIIGRPVYRYRIPEGSPLTPLFQVLVAAFMKRKLALPSTSAELYEVSTEQTNKGRLLCHTNRLRALDRAAILEDKDRSAARQNHWRLATVTQVEELKLIFNMIPIWLSVIPFGITVSQNGFFVKQGSTMNRNFGKHFIMPTASVGVFSAVGMIISVAIYDKILVPALRKITGHERGIKILQRIGIGMVFSIAGMSVSALIEMKRLRAVEQDPIHGSQSMSIFWLAPQHIILGVADGFTLVGLQEYFYDQVPDSMRSLGIGIYLSVIGAGNFVSNLLIIIVDHVTEKYGKSWFGKDVNGSRLDKYYWLISAITAVNLVFYVFVAGRYSYKNVRKEGIMVNQEHNVPASMA